MVSSRSSYPPPPPLQTVNVHTVYLFTQGRGGGGVETEIRGEGQQGRGQFYTLFRISKKDSNRRQLFAKK
jgi:hypothetical protein